MSVRSRSKQRAREAAGRLRSGDRTGQYSYDFAQMVANDAAAVAPEPQRVALIGVHHDTGAMPLAAVASREHADDVIIVDDTVDKCEAETVEKLTQATGQPLRRHGMRRSPLMATMMLAGLATMSLPIRKEEK